MNKKAIRILLIEDNANDVKLLSIELRRYFEITLVNVDDREGYLRELEIFDPTIVISDYNLPTFNGMEALEIRNRLYPLLPFVLVTGSLNEEIAVEVMKSGADDYVIKENLQRLYPSIEQAIERKQILKDKLRSERLLKEAEQRFRTLFMNTVIGLYRTTPEGKIIMANPALINLLGYNSFEELSKVNLETDVVAKDYPRDLFKETIEKNGEVIGFESEWRKHNGEKIFTRENARSVRDESGKILYYEGAVEDITAKKTIEEKLIEAKEKAEEMNRIKSNFFANMSHELRTPLIAILGFSEILLDSVNDNKDSKLMLENINYGGRRLLNTLEMILNIANLSNMRDDIRLNKTNIIPIIHNVYKTFVPKAEDANLQFSIASEKEEIICYIDPERLKNIIFNLLDNAIKYTEKGFVKVEIKKDNEHATIKITDSGIGIPEKKKEVIWEEFRQASEGYGRNYEGTGLGLSITKRLVELMGGLIELNDAEGGGSEFSVQFPIASFTNN
ncbi:MAG: PAS domain S-box protein [Ignavibacteriales bacterium]|jgi:PAS domain S-box-containing protein|nr:ATP-binding protein [Ignavibacteriaceae bacterium]NLH61326.1 PAS domain S-box protein [Ignavibacteriales bacterium]HPO55231.1 ATP-binding protein [Ignavibacteriaceae bacterium]